MSNNRTPIEKIKGYNPEGIIKIRMTGIKKTRGSRTRIVDNGYNPESLIQARARQSNNPKTE